MSYFHRDDVVEALKEMLEDCDNDNLAKIYNDTVACNGGIAEIGYKGADEFEVIV